jgi:Leucine-rich repeat (LRR) protein
VPATKKSALSWDDLDDAWKKVFEDKKKKLASVTDVYIDDESEVSALDLLAKLEKITEINCDAKKVTDLSPLAKLPKLKSLRISSPIRDFSPIAKMAKLESLELSDTSIADLSVLAGLTKLERLDISGTPVTDLAPIAKLKKLERLEINRTKVSDLSPIPKSLQNLDAAHTPIANLSAIAKLDLHTLDVSGTSVASLEPIWNQHQIHILQIRETKLTFEQVLRYVAHRSEEEQPGFIGLDVYSDWTERDDMLAALAAIDFPLAGLEATVTALLNNSLIGFVKDEEESHRAPEVLEIFFKLGIAPNKHTKEIAGNALHVVVTHKVSSELERKVVGELAPQAEMDRRLAYNLACYHAKRGHIGDVLRYAKLALEKGQEAEKFRTDPDFESVRNDTDFVALIATSFTPDPYADPKGWWKSLPEELRECLYFDEDDIRLDEPLELHLSGIRSLDPLRGMKVKSLRLTDCKPSSLEIVGTLQALEIFSWETSEYSDDTKMKDLSPLASCTSLRELDLTGHEATDLSPLAGLAKLESLSLRGNPITSIAALADLALLTDLGVDSETELDLDPLSKMTKLEDLWLHAPVKSLEPIANLKSLRRFWMQGLTAPSLEPLRALQSLEQIWVDDARKKEVKKLLPKAKVG